MAHRCICRETVIWSKECWKKLCSYVS